MCPKGAIEIDMETSTEEVEEDTVVEDQTTSSSHMTKENKTTDTLVKPQPREHMKRGVQLMMHRQRWFHTVQAQLLKIRVRNIALVRDEAVPLDADLVEEYIMMAAEEWLLVKEMNEQ